MADFISQPALLSAYPNRTTAPTTTTTFDGGDTTTGDPFTVAPDNNQIGSTTGTQYTNKSFEGSAKNSFNLSTLAGGMPYTTPDAITGPKAWNVDANQTVASQLEKILKNDNPLMQQARTRAMQQMQARGGLNSTMAATAGESALYDAAMPIATADARTFADAGKFNTSESNVFGREGNQFSREQQMANFNLASNEWAAKQTNERALARDAKLNEYDVTAKAAADKVAQNKVYADYIFKAKSDYASMLAKISADDSMDSGLKNETLRNLATTYNTLIENYSSILGWTPASWLIQYSDVSAAAPIAARATRTPACRVAPTG